MSRGYTWTGKEFLTTSVSVKINNETGKIYVDVEGEASTWGPDGVAGEYPATEPGAPGNNPGDFVPSWPPGVTPETPGGDPPPWATPDILHWPMTIYLALWSGQVIRASPVWPDASWSEERTTFTNLGQTPNAGNLYWMALDQFDPTDTAMVCAYSPNEVYRARDLSSDSPTWELMFGPVNGINGVPIRWSMVQSSALQQGLWMVAGHEPSAPGSVYVRWTTTSGESWHSTRFTSGNAGGTDVFLEMSTHDANRAWVVWTDATNARTYIARTDDMWASQTLTYIPLTCYRYGSDWYQSCHHRSYQNDDDSERLYGGTHWTAPAATNYARLYRGGGVCTTLYSAASPAYPDVPRVGCGDGTLNGWWAIATDAVNTIGFWVWEGGAWVEQATWNRGGGTLESRDCRNVVGEWQSYVAVRDGTPWVFAISLDRGASWSVTIGGEWTTFVSDEGLGDPNVMCLCSEKLLP